MNHLTAGTLVLILHFGVADSSESSRGALDILNRVDNAAKAVRAVEYDFVFDADGEDYHLVPRITGTCALRGWRGRLPAAFRIEFEVTQPGSKTSARYLAGRVGMLCYLVDHQSRKVYVGGDTNVMGSVESFALAGIMGEFVSPEPFRDEIEGRSRLLGEQTLAGEPCAVVRVDYLLGAGGWADWFFSSADHLPRRRIDPADLPNGKTVRLRRTLTRLVIDPAWPEDYFAVPTPPGYERVASPAP